MNKTSNVAILIGVRMKSSRLPKKALLDLKGKAVVERLIERLKTAKLPERIVLCTSVNPEDTPLVEVALRNNIECFRGSEDDKLDRYLNAAKLYGADFVIITEGDNIFFDPDIIDNIIKHFALTNADYVSCKNLPLGTTPHGVKVAALEKVVEMKSESDTEVWGGYFTETGLFRTEYIDIDPSLNHPELRLTLDYPNDYKLFQAIFDKLHSEDRIFSLKEIVSLLVQNPKIADINRVEMTSYLEHLKKSPQYRVKPMTNNK